MIQLVIFKKLLLNPVKKVIAERKAKADSQIADAEKLRTEAEAMKAEYEQNLQNARTEANQIVAAAQKTAAARSEELLGEARAQAAALKQKAEADIAQERKKAVNEVKDEIGGMAMEIASKAVSYTHLICRQRTPPVLPFSVSARTNASHVRRQGSLRCV